MPDIIEIRKSKDDRFFPSYLNGVLKKFALGSHGGKRYITLELYTDMDWTVLGKEEFGLMVGNITKSNEFSDNFIRSLEL